VTTVNQEQFDAWNGDSGQRWVADADRRDRVLQPVADALLEAANLRRGETVLDIGCGCGITTLAAANAVAPGVATGIDVSAPMLDVARRRASAVETAVFVQADAQTYRFEPATVDVAISRFGTMFFDDPVAAFSNMRRALRADGRLCIATWQPLAANDWLTIPGSALLRYGSLPDAGENAPGMFAQSEPAVVQTTLRAAGWQHVGLESITLTLRLGADAAEATQHLADSGPGRAVLDTIAEGDRARAIDAVVDTLTAYEGHDGVRLGGAIYLVRARVDQ
jgi:SAM-dependent methyltransferase